MKKLTGSQALWVAAWALLGIGLLATARTLHDLNASRAHFARAISDLSQLRVIGSDLRRYLDARDAYEALPAARVQDPRDALSRIMPGTRVDEAKEQRAEVAPGWTARRREYVFAAAPFPKIMEFVEAVETQRPPWRMVRCTLRATSPQGGTGQAAIMLEALERSGGTER